ncbi:hypothetical protein C0992_012638 [Termitomyces sp. T32_za158]|nr:hypothetical protein C0992_012638 [Termitomyces sp. T32_za158]
MASRGPPKFGQSLQSSGKGGRPGQGPLKKYLPSDLQQYAAAPYLGREAPLPYETLLHAQMEVDQEEERYEHQFQEVCHERYYQLGLSHCQALAQTYARAVAPDARREVAPQAQPEMGTEVLMQRLEAAGQPVPPTASFLQDNLAVMVMEGLLNQIELMRRQRVSALEQIDCAAKCKLSSLKGVSGEIKRARPQPAWPVESARPLGAASSRSIPAMAPAPLSLPARPTAVSIVQPAVMATVAHEPKVPDVPVEEILLDQRDEEMDEVPLTREDLEFMDHFESMASSAGQKVGLASRGLAGLLHAPNVLGPSKNHRGQLTVVKLTIDLRTLAQYNGLTATAAAGKGKQWAVPTIDNDSNYGQSQSEEEEEAKEGESAAQRMQCNKKLTKKKANRAKAAAAIVHRVQNNFSGRIPDGLGAKFACRRFPGTPYELKRLYNYYANPHVPRRNRIVAYMLLSELKDFTQRCDVALHNCTMTLLCSDPAYWDLINPMQGLEDLSYAEKRHIPSRFLRVKDDGATTLCMTHTPDPNVLFDLDQIVRYALIFGRPGMKNTWQGIAVDFAYQMHWRTLFGFALCRALCANSTRKTTLVCWMALVMACPGLYCEAINAFNKVYDEPFAAQYGPQLTITQVHIPDNKVRNFSDNDVICVLLYNYISVEWVDHAYTYEVVYLEQQLHYPTMSLDIFWEVDDERLERLRLYGTPAAIPQWDGWHELTKEDHYYLMFKRAEESVAGLFPEADGLYYYIGMDPNVGQLWKRTPAHSTMPSIGAATNITLTDCEMVNVTAAGGPTTPPITESEPLPSATNIAIEESVKTTEAGKSQLGKKTG